MMNRTAYMTEKIFFALGTVCRITVYDGNVHDALEHSKRRVMEIHERMNAYDMHSEVSRINASAGSGFVKVSDDTFRLIKQSVRYSQQTDGLYDITSRPSSELWKASIASRTLPSAYMIRAAADLVNYRDILLNSAERSVMLKRHGQQLDLGAIAKGYAADEVRRILLQEDVTEALINLGGTVVTLGSCRRIGIRHPFKKSGVPFAYIDLSDKAVVTSGTYEQGAMIDGRHCHHIIHPKTGSPSDADLVGVTLIGDHAEQLDALSTAVFMMGIRRAVPMLQRLGIEAIFVSKDGNVFTTDNISGRCAKAG